MFRALFRRRANKQLIDRLHAGVVAAARRESLYRDYDVADSVDGRFEMLVLHAALVMRRLRTLSTPGPDMAQDLADAVFRHLDSTLREAGIGDTSVPKRMKKLAESFYGRASAYEPPLAAGDGAGLADALARNVLPVSGTRRSAERLAAYVFAVVAELGTLEVEDFAAGRLVFPDPADVS